MIPPNFFIILVRVVFRDETKEGRVTIQVENLGFGLFS